MPEITTFTLQQQPERRHEIARLLYDQWHEIDNWSDVAAVAERLRQRNLPDSATVTLLAVEGDRLAATASVIEHELDDVPARRFWLGEVFTVPAFRGRGIGSALVQRIIDIARQRDMQTLWLYTPDRQALYARLGWQEAEQREVAGEWVSIMKRQL